MDPDQSEQQLARKTRMVSIVIALTMLIWIGVQYFGKQYGLAGRFALLFDFAALAAFFWSLVVIYQIWRSRRQD